MDTADLERAEKVIHDLIADIEDRITGFTDPVEVSALKGVVFFLEDKWGALMDEVKWRLEV